MRTPTWATGIRSVPERRSARARGFTLLELVFVVALVGLALAFATLSVDGFSDPRPEDEARALADRIALILEESAFTGRVIGLRLRDDPDRDGDETIEFVALTLAEGESRPAWTAADPKDRLLAPARLGERLRVALAVEATPADGEDAEPEVLLQPDGEVTPFVLTLAARSGAAPAATLSARADGQLELGRAKP